MSVAEMCASMEWAPLPDPIIHRPSPNYGYAGAKPRWRAVTWHITDGDLEATLSWLTAPVSQASAHIVVARDGSLYNLVPLDQPAWAQGNVCRPDRSNPIVDQTVQADINPNLVSYSIECVGYSRHGVSGALTSVQSDALTRITAYLCWRSRLTADRTHILGHYQWDGCTRSECPGYSRDEWATWVGRVHALCLLWRGW